MKKIISILVCVCVVLSAMVVPVSATDGAKNVVLTKNSSSTTECIIDLLEFGDYLLEAGSSSKYYDSVLADAGETGTEADPIIIDNAEEFVYICKAAGDETKGNYYKVADGIKGFDLSRGDLDLDGTLADNIDKVKACGKNHSGAPAFQGYFDGNGVTVYGAWTNHNEGQISTYAGLFTTTKGEVTIKNIHVKFASFTAKSAAGGIVGFHDADSMCTLTIENCSVTDSHLEISDTGYGTGVGAILGFGKSAPSYKNDEGTTVYVNVLYNIKNCYVNLDEEYFVSKAEDGELAENERVCHGGVVGVAGSNAVEVRDCVVIGIKPYSVTEGTFNDVQHTGRQDNFKGNIYTTSDVQIEDVVIGGNGQVAAPISFAGLIYPLSDDELKGAAALDNLRLDWSIWMADDEGYPELRNAHKDVTFVDNGDGTHNEVCACGFGGVASNHIWVDNACECGAILDCSGRKTICWDGSETAISVGSGTEEDPYIINTASEFAWLIKNSTAANTTDKYYKIADDIGTIVLQDADFAEDILALESAEEVQEYFEDITYVFSAWPNMGWEQTAFSGVFDGNGATVYGLYQTSPNNAGLFSTVDAGAVIKNIAVKNSYITSEASNYQVGAIVPVTSNAGYGRMADGIVLIENVTVANNYLYNASTNNDRSGVVVGAGNDAVYIENCLVYGNIAIDGQGRNMPLINTAKNAVLANGTEIVPEGVETVVGEAAVGTVYYNMVRNSVIMGTEPYDVTQTVGSRFNDPNCYENVYTDAAANTFFTKVSENQIKTVTVGELATLKLGEGWLNTATYPELAVFHDDELVIVANANGTHSETCSCGFEAIAPCDFVDGECSVCAADLTCASKRTVYWDGSVASGFASTAAGTKDDPIIINSAAELAYLISSKADVTADKYFEIAEDIGTIVLQSQEFADEIIALESAAEVQEYFENVDYIFAEWPEKSWEASCFAGHFDGNGVKVYGLYIDSDTNAGLFSTVDAGAAIRNIAVYNSYFYSHSTQANYQVGGIAAVASNGSYGIGEAGMIWIDGCVVGNCFMRNDGEDYTRSGVIFGAASSDSITIDNCLVFGNDAYHGGSNPIPMSLINNTNNSIIAPAKAPVELDALVQDNCNANGDSMYRNAIRNTIALGTDIMDTNAVRSNRRNDPESYVNNFTDGASGTVVFGGESGEWTYEESQIMPVTLDTLNDYDLGSAWVKTDSYPELAVGHVIDAVDNGDGTHSMSCACGAVTGDAMEHSFVDGECICGDTECEHKNGKKVVENNVEATCAQEGSYEEVIYCSDCGMEFSRTTVVVPILTHITVRSINYVDPTCTQDGYREEIKYCKLCGEILGVRWLSTLPATGHSWAEPVFENLVGATCSQEGSYDEINHCSKCDEETRVTNIIAKKEHTYTDDSDSTCNVCGYVRFENYIKPGDANGDGKINGRDYGILLQCLNGWEVEIVLETADVNADGKVNGRDYGLLMQYLNGWDVELK